MTDDLERSRLTVFLRLILAIPHFFWLGLFGIVELVVVVVNWFAALATGRAPDGLHEFMAGYLRYAAHVNAYLLLVANPYPRFFLGSRLEPYPVDLQIDAPARQSRISVLLRLFAAIPALLLAGAAVGGGGTGSSRWSGLGIAPTGAFLTWFSALVTGRAPRGLRDMSAWGIGYMAQTYGYLFVLTDRYPRADPVEHLRSLPPPERDPHRPELVNDDDLRRSRLTVLFRLPLAVPHIVWLLGWSVLAALASVANWLWTLVAGRSPRLLVRFLAAYVRYSTHVNAFLWLVGNPFPGFVGAAGSYPVDPRISPPGRQRRWITAFRLPLAVPALIVSGALSNLLLVAAFLGWFASLATGRMPSGLQGAGAAALGYSAELSAYTLVLTDRYPHASPLAILEPPAAVALDSTGALD